MNLPMKKIGKSIKIWQNYGHESVAPFFGPPCIPLISARTLSTAICLDNSKSYEYILKIKFW